jgi:hypothetical protein
MNRNYAVKRKMKVFERMYGEGKRNESGLPGWAVTTPTEAATRLLCVYKAGNLQGRTALMLN